MTRVHTPHSLLRTASGGLRAGGGPLAAMVLFLMPLAAQGGGAPESVVPRFEVARTFDITRPGDREADLRRFIHLVDDGVSTGFLVLPDRLLRFDGPLGGETILEMPELASEATAATAVHFSGGRLFHMGAAYEGEGGRKAYHASDDRGATWISLENSFYHESERPGGGIEQKWLTVTSLQRSGGLLYADAGGWTNLFVSADNGETWEIVHGEPVNWLGSSTVHLVAGRSVFFGGMKPIGEPYFMRGRLSDDGRSLEGDPVAAASVGLPLVLAQSPHTEALFAGSWWEIRRSRTATGSFERVLSYQEGAEALRPPGDPSIRPHPQYILPCRVTPGRVFAAGHDHTVPAAPFLVYSDDDGAPGSWVRLSDLLAPHGRWVALLEQDPSGRVLVGVLGAEADEPLIIPTFPAGVLTVGELVLPDPLAPPGGWLHREWFGWVNTEGRPWYFHAELGPIYAEAFSAAGMWFYDLGLGWTYASARFPRTYFNAGQGWLYHAPGGRHFYRFADGLWFED